MELKPDKLEFANGVVLEGDEIEIIGPHWGEAGLPSLYIGDLGSSNFIRVSDKTFADIGINNATGLVGVAPDGTLYAIDGI